MAFTYANAVHHDRHKAGAADALDISTLAGQTILAQMAPGSRFEVYKSGSNWLYAGVVITARPTTRGVGDLRMIAISTDGTFPSFAIAEWDLAETIPA